MSKKLSVLIRLTIGLSILSVILYQTHLNEDVLGLLYNSKIEYIILGLSVFFIHYTWIFIRWFYLLNIIGKFSFSKSHLLKSLLGGNALGLVTPGRVGELARGIFFEKKYFWKISGLSVIDKGYAQIISIFLGVTGLWFIGLENLDLGIQNRVLIYIFNSFLLIAGTILIAKPRLFSLAVEFFGRFLPAGWRKYITPLSENLRHLTRKESIILALISILVNVTSFIEFYVILHAFTDADLMSSFWAFEAAYLTVNFLPFSFSDLGIREGFRVFFFSSIGVSAAAVLNTSIIMFFFNAIIPAAIGLIAIPQIRTFSESRQ